MSEPFKWSSHTGHTLCQNILKGTALEYQTHNWQMQGICQCPNIIDLFTITPTGSGKTGCFTMYILVVLAVSKNTSLYPTAKFLHDPCLMVICLTILLQLEMVCAQKSLHFSNINMRSRYTEIKQAAKMSKIGLRVTAINTLTCCIAVKM